MKNFIFIYTSINEKHWKGNVAILAKISLVVVMEVVIWTTSIVAKDENIFNVWFPFLRVFLLSAWC